MRGDRDQSVTRHVCTFTNFLFGTQHVTFLLAAVLANELTPQFVHASKVYMPDCAIGDAQCM